MFEIPALATRRIKLVWNGVDKVRQLNSNISMTVRSKLDG